MPPRALGGRSAGLPIRGSAAAPAPCLLRQGQRNPCILEAERSTDPGAAREAT